MIRKYIAKLTDGLRAVVLQKSFTLDGDDKTPCQARTWGEAAESVEEEIYSLKHESRERAPPCFKGV